MNKFEQARRIVAERCTKAGCFNAEGGNCSVHGSQEIVLHLEPDSGGNGCYEIVRRDPDLSKPIGGILFPDGKFVPGGVA